MTTRRAVLRALAVLPVAGAGRAIAAEGGFIYERALAACCSCTTTPRRVARR